MEENLGNIGNNEFLKNNKQNFTNLLKSLELADNVDYELIEDLVNSYLDDNEYSKASRLADIFIKNYPYSAEAFHLKALCLDGLGKYLESLEYYNRAISFDPTDPELYLNKAITLDSLKLHSDAIENFKLHR